MWKIRKLEPILILILFAEGIVNLIGALGPELGFDALWYHLTLPKLFIEQEKIFIPGNLLYYSLMPKLIELLYIPAIYLGGETIAKVTHFLFGIGSLIVLYKLSRFFLSKSFSLLVLVVFYSNLIVAWQSITAYIDLGRTFFEVLALFFIVSYFKNKEDRDLTKSALSIGLAISTKLLAIGSLFIFILIFFFEKLDLSKIIKFILIAIIIPSPWFIFSYLNTGNSVYPFFSEIYYVSPSINILNLLNFVRSPDPISPIYLIVLPLIFLACRKFDRPLSIVAIYSLLSFIVWFITPQTGGGRFIMPYLPAFSIVVVASINFSKNTLIKRYLIALIILIAVSSIIYRGVANAKYLPVLFGKESKHEFLSKNLNFDFGDFYDTDNYFRDNIKPSDKVLIYGTHNLYYVNFPFTHESWLAPDDKFNYVMTQNVDLPGRFSDWKQIYSNERTHVKLYSKD
mgnify:CR=1 FL=1